MTDPIASLSRYLSADVRALGTLSQNVANLTTPGFRAVQRVEGNTRVDTRDGALMHTGRPLDLALQGDGFFQVSDGQRTFLTRNGQFVLGADGRVTDTHGRALMGQGGPVSLDSDAVVIGEDGAIRSKGEITDHLAIASVTAGAGLSAVGDGLYVAADGAAGEGTAKVHQGALEGSNVDPGHEMVQLMELTRHAGSMQHAMSTYHAALMAGIDELGKDS